MSVVALPPARARHRRTDLHGDLLQVMEVVARIGSGVTLAALVVVAGAVGGLVDGSPAGSAAPTVQATFGPR
jgi:hypothetical protein